MNYTDFFSGVGVTLIVMACIWLYRTLRTDPVPEIPQKPRRKYRPRKPRPAANESAALAAVDGMTDPRDEPQTA